MVGGKYLVLDILYRIVKGNFPPPNFVSCMGGGRACGAAHAVRGGNHSCTAWVPSPLGQRWSVSPRKPVVLWASERRVALPIMLSGRRRRAAEHDHVYNCGRDTVTSFVFVAFGGWCSSTPRRWGRPAVSCSSAVGGPGPSDLASQLGGAVRGACRDCFCA